MGTKELELRRRLAALEARHADLAPVFEGRDDGFEPPRRGGGRARRHGTMLGRIQAVLAMAGEPIPGSAVSRPALERLLAQLDEAAALGTDGPRAVQARRILDFLKAGDGETTLGGVRVAQLERFARLAARGGGF